MGLIVTPSKFKTALRSVQGRLNSKWGYSILLLFVGLISCSLFVRDLGFYWDDWQAVYLERAGHIRLLWDFFTFDRPFSTWTFVVLFPVLGANPVAWQISTLLIRWLGVLCFVLTLSELFPEQVGWMRWAGLMMMVYPGFDSLPLTNWGEARLSIAL